MTVYDLLAPVYGVWASLTETKAHELAVAMVRACRCQRLLEVGVGTGTAFARLAADPGRALCAGVDLSATMLQRAQARLHRNGCGVLCRADARALPFPTSMFDCVLSCYTLDLLAEHDIGIVLREVQRVLRPDGRLVLAVMGHQAPLAEQVWMVVFRHRPVLVGNCRPINAAALTGGSTPFLDKAPPEDRTPSAMLARLEKADAAFHSVLTDVRDRGAWLDTFVDALCEPPETFTFGGMFAHVITFNAYRRMVAIDVLRGLGVKVEGVGCPMEYVESLAKT